MEDFTFEHTEEWFAKLTCTVYELTPSEHSMIVMHTLSCPDCSHFLADRAKLEEFIKDLPEPEPIFPEGLSPKLQQLWQEEDANSKQSADFERLIRELME